LVQVAALSFVAGAKFMRWDQSLPQGDATRSVSLLAGSLGLAGEAFFIQSPESWIGYVLVRNSRGVFQSLTGGGMEKTLILMDNSPDQ
jgi:hypothetical protein